eukprot:4807142-Prymnesium_polylepis.1
MSQLSHVRSRSARRTACRRPGALCPAGGQFAAPAACHSCQEWCVWGGGEASARHSQSVASR